MFRMRRLARLSAGAHARALYRTEGVLHDEGPAHERRRVVHRPGFGRWVREAGVSDAGLAAAAGAHVRFVRVARLAP